MLRALTLAALLLPFAGCYAPPGAGYVDGYSPQPDYQPQPYADSQYGYAGYDYNGGSPYMSYEGASVPLIYYGGYWGFYDHDRRFRHAPDSVGRLLESRHPGGYGANTYGGRSPESPYGFRPQGAPRPQYQPTGVAPLLAAPPPRPFAPAFATPQQRLLAPAFAEPPPRPAAPAFAAPRPLPNPVAPAFAAPVPRPAAPAAPARHEEHRERQCPNGQTRC